MIRIVHWGMGGGRLPPISPISSPSLWLMAHAAYRHLVMTDVNYLRTGFFQKHSNLGLGCHWPPLKMGEKRPLWVG